MKEWAIRLILLAALAAIGFWAWSVLFPNPEKIIRKRLDQVAKALSFSSDQGLVAKAWSASSFAEYFTPDLEITVEVPGLQHTISGRDELMQAVMAKRRMFKSLKVTLPDVKVTLAPDKTSAEVYLTGEARVPGEKEFFLQELRLRLIKVKRDWLINRVETVKTLS
jgi:SnoaL-like domain